MDIRMDVLLTKMVEMGGSDLHLQAGSRPAVRVDGVLKSINGYSRMLHGDISQAVNMIINEKQRKQFLEINELDFAYGVPSVGRFRINICVSRAATRLVARRVSSAVGTFEDLNLPKERLEMFCALKQGLVLVTGPTGSGKSTTIAAMIDLINNTRDEHIITIEDPTEFIHRGNRCIVTQREVGTDTASFLEALRRSLRQDPDVIMIGEMRDLETISTAITAAETGHLVLSTLHTSDAPGTIDRIIDIFPPNQQSQIRTMLASALSGIICQKMLPREDGPGRIPATEILENTSTIKELIRKSASPERVWEAIKGSPEFLKVHTLNSDLVRLVKAGVISKETALGVSPKPDDFKLELRGAHR